jgi:hypothetical protein
MSLLFPLDGYIAEFWFLGERLEKRCSHYYGGRPCDFCLFTHLLLCTKTPQKVCCGMPWREWVSILFCFIFNNNQAAKETYVRRLWSRRRRESYYGTSFLFTFTRRAIGVFEREIMLRKGHTIILEIIEESASVFYDLFMRNHSRWNAFL